MDLYDLVRPALFRLAPDRAHDLARLALRMPPIRTIGAVADAALATDLGGVTAPTPVGLAPGFDKDGALLPQLLRWGFGYLVVGSVTLAPRRGNPRPRLARRPDSASLVNAMGLPGPGVDVVVERLRRVRRRVPAATIIVNVSGNTAEDVAEVARRVRPVASVVELGLFCPNTGDEAAAVTLPSGFAEAVGRVREVVHDRPLHVKLPAFHDEQGRARVLAMADVCIRAGAQGLSVYGVRRVAEPRLALGAGTLSGGAVRGASLRVVRDVAAHVRGRLRVRAAGGVSSGEDALRFLRAGADAVELYAAVVYRGPRVASTIVRELTEALDADGAGTSVPAQRRRSAEHPGNR